MRLKTLSVLMLRQRFGSLMGMFRRRYSDLLGEDEIVSAVDLGIVKAMRHFNPELGRLVPYARYWVYKELQKAAEGEWRWRARHEEIGEGVMPQVQYDLPAKIDARPLLALAAQPRHQMWRRQVTEGLGVRELSAVYGVSVRQVRNQINHSKRVLRQQAGGGRPSQGATARDLAPDEAA